MLDVVALGEILIDFTPAGTSPNGNVLFERNPGGAPANVLAAVRRLGGTAAFLGMVGEDAFGTYLRTVLEDLGVDVRGLCTTKKADTTLAFVHLDTKGDRSFSFYRRPGADTQLTVQNLEKSVIDEGRIFHFGSLSLTTEPSRSATLAAAAQARSKGLLVSYDPNWRPPLWQNDGAAKVGMQSGLPFADLLKVSETELEFLTGENDLEAGSAKLFDADRTLVLVTLGPKGCFFRTAQGTGRVAAYDTAVIDTTGAGDAFLGAFLYRVAKLDARLEDLGMDEIEEIADFASAAGSLCASRRGAIPGMPHLADVERCRREIPKLIVT
jgi:fructokinase